jgi:hypothetical protein
MTQLEIVAGSIVDPGSDVAVLVDSEMDAIECWTETLQLTLCVHEKETARSQRRCLSLSLVARLFQVGPATVEAAP